jgi:alanine racemase
MSQDQNTTWIEVNLAAIQRNIKHLQTLTSKPAMAVVKANAYGHGLVEVARAAAYAGVIRLCVARIEEALRLREAGVQTPILVLGYMMPELVEKAIGNRISVMVNSLELASQFNNAASSQKERLQVHLKIDSGMHRLGLLPEQVEPFAKGIKSFKHIQIEGIFTHFPNADDLQDTSTDGHIAYFTKTVEQLRTFGVIPEIVHAANSAAAIYFPTSRFDAIRPGIAIYGLNPDFGAPLPEGFEPALTWKGRITSIKIIPAGEGVGYNYRYFTTRTERIGVAAVGYADGLRRRQGNIALLKGKRIHQVGGMCMDQSLWQLDELPDAKVGDEVVFVGKQGNEHLKAEEVGQLWESNNYDVVCGLTARVPRYYHFD